MQQKTNRIAYLDVLKGISMMLVIYCHGVLLPYHSVVGNLMMTLAWGAVPCFVMASGAVLHQGRHFAWKKHGKRVGGMYVTLVCWRLLYLVVYRQERSPGFPFGRASGICSFYRITREWIQVLCGI